MEELVKYIKSHKQFYNKVIKKYITKEVEATAIFYKLSIKELCYRIKHDISFDKVFKCKTCGKIIKFKRTHGGYQTYCSMSCMNKSQEHVNKVKQTCLRKYNTTSYAKTKECRDKIKQTCLNKYGVDSYLKTQDYKDKYKQTCLEKYGTEYYSQSDQHRKYMQDNKYLIQQQRELTNLENFGKKHYTQTDDYIKKSNQTCKDKYGVDYYSQTKEYKDKVKQTCLDKFGATSFQKSKKYKLDVEKINEKQRKTNLERYGVENYTQTQEYRDFYKEHKAIILEKQWSTKKQNNTYNKSKFEEKTYQLLLTKFGKEDIIRQYKNELYPYQCDFYIKSLDLYIEYNGHWTHGKESFDKNNLEHLNILSSWQVKSKKSKFFRTAIYVWTDLDARKLETFKKNKLNYKIFWNIEEVEDWIRKIN